MKSEANIHDVASLQPDFLGFIFYKLSKRNALSLPPQVVHQLPSKIQRVGVFVNEQPALILQTARNYALNLLQLHGDETPQTCQQLRQSEFKIVKAFSIDSNFDFSALEVYEDFCDYFLFDTKGENYGGNGITFDWSLLQKYTLSLPFFLSGGIDLGSVEIIESFQHAQLYALDINSKFEDLPGEKNVEKIKKFKDQLFHLKQSH